MRIHLGLPIVSLRRESRPCSLRELFCGAPFCARTATARTHADPSMLARDTRTSFALMPAMMLHNLFFCVAWNLLNAQPGGRCHATITGSARRRQPEELPSPGR